MNDLIVQPTPPSIPGDGLVRFRPPVMGICRNPLLGSKATEMHEVPVGVRLRDFVIEANGPVVCLKNGEWLLRDHWDELTAPGDVILWCVYPQGRETVRLLLTVATIAANIFAPGSGTAIALTLSSLAFNLLVPPRQPNLNNEAPGSIFSVGLAGNAARLDQPIWKNCGHVKITPPFATIPYFINLPRADAEDPLLDTEQYGYFLYCVGLGDHEVVRTFFGKTPVSHYQDVIAARYLAPGEQPQDVEANVLTSTDVVELELATDVDGNGIYVGGYVACRPRDRVTKIGIDVSAPQGLGHIITSGSEDLRVEWQIDVREIDDFGIPLAEWTPIGNESRDMDTNTPQRWSNEYELSAPIRCEVRMFRTNEKNRDSDARDQINWAGLKAWLEAPAPLNPLAAHYEIVIRAGKQLSAETQRDFSMLVNGMCPVWDPDTGWTANIVHRNPAWWMVDLWRDAAWGEGLPDSRIDLIGMWTLAQTYDARQDHFDFSFATGMDSAEAAQLIGRSCRTRASSPLGLRTATRDELVTDHFTMFSARNTQSESIVSSYDLSTRERPDAVIVTYQDHVRWDLQEIVCWVPGADQDSSGDPQNPLFVHLDGVIGAKQAEREGLAMAAKVAYRGQKFYLTTEMEGFLVRHMDTVRVQPDLPEYGQTGDVTYWDPATFALELSEPADFSEAPLFITLRRDDGSITSPVEVTAGVNPTTVYLPAAPDFELIFDDGGRERPVYFLGPLSSDEICKIEEIADGGQEDGAQLFDIKLVLDDPRVHSADNALLPGPGEIQDPIDDGTDVPSEGGSTAALVRLRDNGVTSGTPFFPGGRVEFTLFADGTAGGEYADSYADLPAMNTIDFPNQWINTSPVETSVASLYECYAQDYGGFAQATLGGGICTGPLDTWTPLSADVTWTFEADPSTYSGPVGINLADSTAAILLRIRIRRIGSTVIQADKNMSLVLIVGAGGAP